MFSEAIYGGTLSESTERGRERRGSGRVWDCVPLNFHGFGGLGESPAPEPERASKTIQHHPEINPQNAENLKLCFFLLPLYGWQRI